MMPVADCSPTPPTPPTPSSPSRHGGDSELPGRHQRARSVLPELLTAATAEWHRVTLLHYNHEYELIASITGQRVEWIVPRGTADR
jgi:hypothetical protein